MGHILIIVIVISDMYFVLPKVLQGFIDERNQMLSHYVHNTIKANIH